MSYLEQGRAQSNVVRQQAYQSPTIGITESLQAPGLVTPPPSTNGAALANDLLNTISGLGQLANLGSQIEREHKQAADRAKAKQDADFYARMKAQDEMDKANSAEILGMATREANTIQARMVNTILTTDVAIRDTRTPEEVAADAIKAELPENASGLYAQRVYDELIRPTTEAVVKARSDVQAKERASIADNLSSAVFGAKSSDEVASAMESAKQNGIDPQVVLTNGVQALADGNESDVIRAVKFAPMIADPQVRTAIYNTARKNAEEGLAATRKTLVNAYDLRINAAVKARNFGDMMTVEAEMDSVQTNDPNLREEFNGLRSKIKGARDDAESDARRSLGVAIANGVSESKDRFISSFTSDVSNAVTLAVQSGEAHLFNEPLTNETTIHYLDENGNAKTENVKHTINEGDISKMRVGAIHEEALKLSGGDATKYPRERLNLMQKNAIVDPQYSHSASVGATKVSDFLFAGGDEAQIPEESIFGLQLYQIAADLTNVDHPGSPLNLSDKDRKFYELAHDALSSEFVGDNPQSPRAMQRALAFAYKSINKPVNLDQTQQAALDDAATSAGHSIAGEWFDLNRNEDVAVNEVASEVKREADWRMRGGISMEQAIRFATKKVAGNGMKLGQHWTPITGPVPKLIDGQPLSKHIDKFADQLAKEFGGYNLQLYSTMDFPLSPLAIGQGVNKPIVGNMLTNKVFGKEAASGNNFKFHQTKTGRWIITDDRDPLNEGRAVSIIIDKDGNRMPEITTDDLIARVNALVAPEMAAENESRRAGRNEWKRQSRIRRDMARLGVF